ncbi:enoyl-CoA hydratase/isomerase family protein [Bacillus sp. EB600]|uniref:enoyl-CoA hydratase/isomerase family protein n=1 Tax=Bacillus sp. EB600 TaxID=2806345 RepID=UPI00210B1FD3|nr:enoyl-CoA hydratase/isomerase family protein [Bacillus sp. EB600]MCQ6282274.1 enoyl-CoA hydratase/isomerase family protein [Bacillus sp. EB600]
MENNLVHLSIKSHVGIITLNRPEAGNALNEQMVKELLDVSIFCSDSKSIRAVVLTGVGNTFSVGGDLKSFAQEGEGISSHLKIVTTYLHHAISYLTRMNKPLIGAINGVAAGAGMGLVLACDMAYASEQAKFVMAYNRVGLTPDGSGSYFLPRIVGMKRAIELMYTNRQLDANEAMEWGIINHVIQQDQLMDTVLSLSETLATGPTDAYGATKKLFYHSLQETLESQMSMEALQLAERASSEEGKEGISSFIEKRKANFLRD